MEEALDMQVRHQGALLGQARGYRGRMEGEGKVGGALYAPPTSFSKGWHKSEMTI